MFSGWWCNVPILKNDGVRQWEGWHPIYEMENKKCLKPPTSFFWTFSKEMGFGKHQAWKRWISLKRQQNLGRSTGPSTYDPSPASTCHGQYLQILHHNGTLCRIQGPIQGEDGRRAKGPIPIPCFLVGGWAQPLWKMMEFVSWDDEIPNIWKVINNVPDHQPVLIPRFQFCDPSCRDPQPADVFSAHFSAFLAAEPAESVLKLRSSLSFPKGLWHLPRYLLQQPTSHKNQAF